MVEVECKIGTKWIVINIIITIEKNKTKQQQPAVPEITGLYLVNSFQHSKSEKHVRWRDTVRTTHAQAMYFPDWTGLDITFLPFSGIVPFLTKFL